MVKSKVLGCLILGSLCLILQTGEIFPFCGWTRMMMDLGGALLLEKAKTFLQSRHVTDGIESTDVPGLSLFSTTTAEFKVPVVYHPCVCVVLQGSKQAMVEDASFTYRVGDYLVVSVEMPLVGKVLEATHEKPFLSLSLDLDLALMTELVVQLGLEQPSAAPSQPSLFVGQVDRELADGLNRMVSLLQNPRDIPVLAPLLKREIHYRLLTGKNGAAIALTASHGSTMARIAKVIESMKRDISQPIRMEHLAEMAHMSLSSFHSHFKKMTLMSPLQYYKRLRLTTARHIMLSEGADATSTAYRVGYESPSQFSREYARMFGAPPMRDMEGIRLMSGA